MEALPQHKGLHRIDVTGIIWKLDDTGTRRYLITKRAPAKKVMPNRWTVPGGGLEEIDYRDTEATYVNEESPQWYNVIENTLRREIWEEVGLEVSDVRYLLDVVFIRPDGTPSLVLSYYCRYESGEVVLDSDATEYAWVSVDELSGFDLISGIDHEIKLADKRLISTSV